MIDTLLITILWQSRLLIMPAKVIVLAPDNPSEEITKRILDRWQSNVVYLRGSVLVSQPLPWTHFFMF